MLLCNTGKIHRISKKKIMLEQSRAEASVYWIHQKRYCHGCQAFPTKNSKQILHFIIILLPVISPIVREWTLAVEVVRIGLANKCSKSLELWTFHFGAIRKNIENEKMPAKYLFIIHITRFSLSQIQCWRMKLMRGCNFYSLSKEFEVLEASLLI